jgi:hypothetical protein
VTKVVVLGGVAKFWSDASSNGLPSSANGEAEAAEDVENDGVDEDVDEDGVVVLGGVVVEGALSFIACCSIA